MAWTQVKLQIKAEKKNSAAMGTVHQFSWFNPCKAPPPHIPSPDEGTMSSGPKTCLSGEAVQGQRPLSAPTKRRCSQHRTGEPPLLCWQTHLACCWLWLRIQSPPSPTYEPDARSHRITACSGTIPAMLPPRPPPPHWTPRRSCGPAGSLLVSAASLLEEQSSSH